MLTPRLFAPSLSLSSDNDITDVIENTFTTEEERFGEIITIPLVPGGEDIEVTQENKREYVEAITEYRIAKRVEEQQLALQAGLNEVIPQDLLNVFDERELELLIGGMADIDIDDWKKHTDYVRSFFFPSSPLPRADADRPSLVLLSYSEVTRPATRLSAGSGSASRPGACRLFPSTALSHH